MKKIEGGIDNLFHVAMKADAIDLESGVTSYQKYNVIMRRLSDKYGVSLEKVTAIFVSTSPNNDYINNLRSTVSVLDGWKKGKAKEEIVISTYGHCKERAWAYLHGKDFLEATKGPKIKSFYRNIVNPLDYYPVTVDGHMVSAWSGKRMLMKDVATSRFRYEDVAQDIRQLADMMGLIPCQMQGVLWFTWKRINAVVYSGNLNIFGDHWGLDIDPTTIKPFAKGANNAERSKRAELRSVDGQTNEVLQRGPVLHLFEAP